MDESSKKLEKLLEREKTAKLIFAELNNFIELKNTLNNVLTILQQIFEFEAVSIRLRDNGDYPYFVSKGFPGLFIKHESGLCVRDIAGNRIQSLEGKRFLLDCMCGRVIQGRVDTSAPYFTENGSFWTNNLSELLETLPDEYFNRKYCHSCGYESVALIPFKSVKEKIGLLQINDTRKDVFTEDLIEYLEVIAKQIGVAAQNSLIYNKQSTTDNLTNLFNRRGLFNALNLIGPLTKRNKFDIGLMKIDIDNFKQVNENYGHQVGDYVLKMVANIIKNKIRSSDVFGRYSGEQFLLFMSPVDHSFLPGLAEKIRQTVEKETKEDIPVTISIGVAKGSIKTDHKKELALLIKKADESLTRAKSEGRNRYMISE